MNKTFLTRLVLVCLTVCAVRASDHASTVDNNAGNALVIPQATQWAQTFVATADQQDVIACANCLYLSLHVIQLDEKIRRSMQKIIGFTARLHMATARYEQTQEIMSAVRAEFEQFSTIKSSHDAVVEKWQSAVEYCEGRAGTTLPAALAQVTDHATATTLAWSHQEGKPLGSLAQAVNNNIAAVVEKLHTVTAVYEQINKDIQEYEPTDKSATFEDIPLASLFSNNCQELTTCGLGLLLTAQQGLDEGAYGLQAGPSMIFIGYYQALFKAYQERYGADATIPLL